MQTCMSDSHLLLQENLYEFLCLISSVFKQAFRLLLIKPNLLPCWWTWWRNLGATLMVLMMREGFVIIKTLPRPRKTLRRGLTLGGRERSEEDVCFRSLQKKHGKWKSCWMHMSTNITFKEGWTHAMNMWHKVNILNQKCKHFLPLHSFTTVFISTAGTLE